MENETQKELESMKDKFVDILVKHHRENQRDFCANLARLLFAATSYEKVTFSSDIETITFNKNMIEPLAFHKEVDIILK